MPGALERTGDFLQTLDVSGKLIAIKTDHRELRSQGNMIPKDRLNSNGLALLNTLPLPNSPTGPSAEAIQLSDSGDTEHPSAASCSRSTWCRRSTTLLRCGKTWLAENNGLRLPRPPGPLAFRAVLLFHESGLSVGWTPRFHSTIVMEVDFRYTPQR